MIKFYYLSTINDTMMATSSTLPPGYRMPYRAASRSKGEGLFTEN